MVRRSWKARKVEIIWLKIQFFSRQFSLHRQEAKCAKCGENYRLTAGPGRRALKISFVCSFCSFCLRPAWWHGGATMVGVLTSRCVYNPNVYFLINDSNYWQCFSRARRRRSFLHSIYDPDTGITFTFIFDTAKTKNPHNRMYSVRCGAVWWCWLVYIEGQSIQESMRGVWHLKHYYYIHIIYYVYERIAHNIDTNNI